MTSRAVMSYIEEVERNLKGLPANRRRLFLRELEYHLLDEAEARGLKDEAELKALIAEKESPLDLALEISSGEQVDASHRGGAALLAGALIGLATGGILCLQGYRWHAWLAFGIVEGLTVGAGSFWLRRQWTCLGPTARMAMAVLFSTILAIPLGFISLHGFIATRLLYGAFTGYLLEQHERPQPAWQWIMENLLFTGFVLFLETSILHRVPFEPRLLPWEATFNAAIQLGVWGALGLRKSLATRWILAPQNREV